MNWAETKSKSFKKNVKTNVTNLYTQSMYDIKTECCKTNDGYLKKYRTWFEIWLDAKCKEKKRTFEPFMHKIYEKQEEVLYMRI